MASVCGPNKDQSCVCFSAMEFRGDAFLGNAPSG
jgi:hypothetical protein